jgi:hypothetical protein
VKRFLRENRPWIAAPRALVLIGACVLVCAGDSAEASAFVYGLG